MNYLALSRIKESIIYEKKWLNTDEDLDAIGEIIWSVGFISEWNTVISRKKNGNINIYLLLKKCTKTIIK